MFSDKFYIFQLGTTFHTLSTAVCLFDTLEKVLEFEGVQYLYNIFVNYLYLTLYNFYT
jgi:hypothetical protein